MKFWRKLEDILLKDIFVIKSPEMKYVEVAAPKTQIELDRDEILGVLGDYLRAIDVMWSLNDRPLEENIAEKGLAELEKWCKTARPELMEVAFDLAVYPPDDFSETMFESEFLLHMEDFLLVWGYCNRAAWKEKVGNLLGNLEMRPVILSLMAQSCYGAEDFRWWLESLVLNASQLPNEEQKNLAAAVGQIGGEEALQLLSQLATRIDPTRREVLKEIESTKKWVTKNMKGK